MKKPKVDDEIKKFSSEVQSAVRMILETVELNNIKSDILFTACQDICVQICSGANYTKDQYINLMQTTVKLESAKWDGIPKQ